MSNTSVVRELANLPYRLNVLDQMSAHTYRCEVGKVIKPEGKSNAPATR
jgi:hypothetical protein